MKSHTDYLWFETKNKQELVNITSKIEDIVKKSKINEGFCLVSAMHITASIIINDEESGLKQDILEFLEELVPWDKEYRHHQTGEDNGAAHLRNILVGHQQIIPITKAKLDLGPWEQIFYAEFDGQRKKRVIVKVIGV